MNTYRINVMKKIQTLRIRKQHAEEIEKLTWNFSMEDKQLYKFTDIADAALAKGLLNLTLKDVKNTIETRNLA